MYEKDWNNPTGQQDYRTGRTDPPKNRRGPLALVLMAAIFLAGAFTAVRILNIPLFSGEEKPGEDVICFSVVEDSAPGNRQEEGFGLGVSVQTLSEFDRQYYRLPAGVYITDVNPDSDAQKKGITPGDVLTAVDGEAVDSVEKLQQVLNTKKAGDMVEITIYRNGKTRRLNVVLGQVK